MTIKSRLDKIEQHAPALPWIVFKQDVDARDLWHATGASMWQDDATLYAGDVLEELETSYNLVLMTWDQDTPADIRMTWGDD